VCGGGGGGGGGGGIPQLAASSQDPSHRPPRTYARTHPHCRPRHARRAGVRSAKTPPAQCEGGGAPGRGQLEALVPRSKLHVHHGAPTVRQRRSVHPLPLPAPAARAATSRQCTSGGAGRRQIDTARAGTVLRYRFCVSSHTTTVRSAEHEAMTWPNSGCAQSTLYTALECRSSGALLCVHCPSAL
jgi:hypothetical protein